MQVKVISIKKKDNTMIVSLKGTTIDLFATDFSPMRKLTKNL